MLSSAMPRPGSAASGNRSPVRFRACPAWVSRRNPGTLPALWRGGPFRRRARDRERLLAKIRAWNEKAGWSSGLFRRRFTKQGWAQTTWETRARLADPHAIFQSRSSRPCAEQVLCRDTAIDLTVCRGKRFCGVLRCRRSLRNSPAHVHGIRGARHRPSTLRGPHSAKVRRMAEWDHRPAGVRKARPHGSCQKMARQRGH
jgi:hypothetical protein